MLERTAERWEHDLHIGAPESDDQRRLDAGGLERCHTDVAQAKINAG